MATSETLDIKVGADTGDAQRSIAELATGVERLAESIGGEIGAKAGEAAGRLRELGQQEAAIQSFLQLREKVKAAEQGFTQLSHELELYSLRVGDNPTAGQAQALERLRTKVDEAGRALANQRAQADVAQRHMESYGVAVGVAQQALGRVQTSLTSTARGIAGLDSRFASQIAGWRGIGTEAQRVPPILERVRASIGKAFDGGGAAVNNFKAGLQSCMGTLLSLRGVLGAVKWTAGLQDARVALAGVAGSAEEARKQFEFVTRVANEAGSDIQESTEQWMKLSAAAKGTALEGQAARDVFSAVTVAMSNLGRSGGETGAVLQTLTQIINGEDVSARQLERTLGTQLPGALQAAAKGFGVTEAELRKMLDSGEITAETLLPALAKGLNDFNENAPPVNKVSDAFQKLKNNIALIGDEFGNSGVNESFSKFAELATGVLQIVADKTIVFGKIIGTTLGAIVSMDFSNFSNALLEIADESDRRMARVAQNNEYIRRGIEMNGNAFAKAALAEADAAAKTAEAGGAAAAAAPQLEALGMSYKQLEAEVGKVKDTQALELEVIQARIKAAQDDLAQENLSVEGKIAAQAALEEARKAEQEYYANLLKQKGEALVAAQEELKAAEAQAAASEEEKERLKPVIANLKTLVLMREQDVQKTIEQVKAAEENAAAMSQEAKDAEKARKALEDKNKARKLESDAIITTLQAQKESARVGEELAKQMGNEYQVRQYKIQQLEIEVKITLAKAEAARAEAQGSIDVANAQMDELRAKGQLTDAKKAELQASIALGEAKLKEAAAIKEGAAIQERAVQAARSLGTATSETAQQSRAATTSAAEGWYEVGLQADWARQAVDGYSSSVRNAPPPPSGSSGGGSSGGGSSGGGSSGGGSSGDSGGGSKRNTGGGGGGIKVNNWLSAFNMAKSMGVSEDEARSIASALYSDGNLNMQLLHPFGSKVYKSASAVVAEMVAKRLQRRSTPEEEAARLSGRGGGQADAGQQQHGAARGVNAGSGAAGTTVNINLNGRRTQIGVNSAADAHQLERLLREIANDQERAA